MHKFILSLDLLKYYTVFSMQNRLRTKRVQHVFTGELAPDRYLRNRTLNKRNRSNFLKLLKVRNKNEIISYKIKQTE